MNTSSRFYLCIGLATVALAGCQKDERQFMVGTLERDRIELVVEHNEPIEHIPVIDGQNVSHGDVILQQSPQRYEARLEQQKALRDQSAGRLAELQRGPREELILEAQARLQGSSAQVINARKNLQRAKELFDKGVGQEVSVDTETARLEAAIAQQKADKEALERLENGTTREELMQASAALAAAEAAVTQAELDLQRLTLTAPVNGTVDKVWFQLGERPLPGTRVAVILDDSRVFARIYVPQAQRTQIQPGTRLNVALDGVENVLQGTVRWVSSDATFTPYFALTEHDRSRLSYLAEVDIEAASDFPSGLPVQVWHE